MRRSEKQLSVIVADGFQDIARTSRYSIAQNRALDVDAHGRSLRPLWTNGSKIIFASFHLYRCLCNCAFRGSGPRREPGAPPEDSSITD
jgi:hypothetical protein